MSKRIRANLAGGKTYEETYRGWVEMFGLLASSTEPMVVEGPPWTWVPLIVALGHVVETPIEHFRSCAAVRTLWQEGLVTTRQDLEVVCGWRPETVDALWKCDNQWGVPLDVPLEQAFAVTTTNSFGRAEIRNYWKKLDAFTPSRRKALILPCAADKPYPSPLHSMAQSIAGPEWYIVIATGTLGVIPDGLWGLEPEYDSGVANFERVTEYVRRYFTRHAHERIAVYSDFYSTAIRDGLSTVGCPVTWVVPIEHRYDYEDLLSPRWLARLEIALKGDER